jgi:hypothetical protein
MASSGGYMFYRHNSRVIQAARRAGINIDIPKPHLPVSEQEETDTM